jgi:hypothetical protein
MPNKKGRSAFMQAGHLTRRFVLLLPLSAAACGSQPEPAYDPLRYNYLPPIQLNVAAITIEQRFVPAGVEPDVSNQDPVPPIEALKAMANDRLQAFGTANKAVFAILDATILDNSGTQLGFAEARVQSRHSGRITAIRPVLYDMTKAMMTDMNVEFEFQIRRALKDYLTTPVAPGTPVEQAPLDKPPAE